MGDGRPGGPGEAEGRWMGKPSPERQLELGREKADGKGEARRAACVCVCKSVDKVVGVSSSQPELAFGGHQPREDGWN